AGVICVVNVTGAAQQESNLASTTNVPAATAATTTNATTNETTAAQAGDSNLVKMNFRGAPLEQVLNHLSETAGFIINIRPGTTIRGKVDMFSGKPMTKEEALDLLDTALNQNGLGAIRNGRTLTIVN